jgi:phage gpG-like protein
MKGLKELQSVISERGFTARVNKSMKAYVKKVVQDAKSNAPSQITYLDNGASTTQSTNVGSSIFGSYENGEVIIDSNDPQAPYIEFGTGKFAAEQVGQYEAEWQNIAAQFIVNRQGTLISYPFIYPAVNDNYPMIMNLLEKELNG